jgi:hypothetical protein
MAMHQDLIPITQLVLPIPDAINHAAWQQSRDYPTIAMQWRVYLNQVAGQVLLPYLQEDFPDARFGCDAAAAARMWQSINGTVLCLNQKRLLLLPDKAIDQSQWLIAAQWVDDPDWVVDYFMPVRVDLDEQFVHCLGYITQEQLKAKGRYVSADRAYDLDPHDLFSDVSALWVVQQLNPMEVTQREALSSVNAALIQQVIEDRATTAVRTTIELGQWLQNAFTIGWQAVEDFFDQDAELALALRQSVVAPAAPAQPTIRRVKALRLPDQLLLLLLTIAPQADGRLQVQVQLRAADALLPSLTDNRRQTLPVDLSLELLSSNGAIVQSVQARQQDNAIQLARFQSPPGTQFTIQVRLAGMSPELCLSEFFVV